jgi:hypothetical protein
MRIVLPTYILCDTERFDSLKLHFMNYLKEVTSHRLADANYTTVYSAPSPNDAIYQSCKGINILK